MGVVTTFLRSSNTGRLDPYPVHVLRRVDRPTTLINEREVQRVDERESGFNRARRGDFGPYIQKEVARFVGKYPLSAALAEMAGNLADLVDGEIA
ncbi:MAG: hypothetical protein JRJ03_08915, partial [Deltaproteobacteria bacterium]|nr:hypothetical protein [Deltaproteobacteria bacterium]